MKARRSASRAAAIGIGGAALCLNGCAAAARSTEMMATPDASSHVSAGDRHYHQIFLRDVEGGHKTAALSRSNVSNVDLRAALDSSLRITGYGVGDSTAASVELIASLVRLDRPWLGFTSTVTSIIRYKAVSRETRKPVFEESIKATGSATVSDAFIAVARLRIANERSIRANIECFLSQFGRHIATRPEGSDAQITTCKSD